MRKNPVLYAVRKLLVFLLSVWLLSLIVFCMARLAPGDPLSAYYGERLEKMSVAEKQQARQRLGLDKPLLEQYGIDALICGAVSDEERRAAGMAGLMLFPGASGKADDAALGFLSGSVVSDPSNHCNACGFKSACSLKGKGGCGK